MAESPNNKADYHVLSLILVSIVVLIFVVLASVLATWIASTFYPTAWKSWSDQWGNYTTFAGFLVSVVGFVWTIIFARGAISAARQAELAANDVKQSISRFDTVVKMTEAIAILNEIINDHRNEEWQRTLHRYQIIRTHLITIKAAGTDLLDTQRTKIGACHQQLSDIQAEIEQCLTSQTSPKKPLLLLRVLSEQHDNLVSILSEIRYTPVSENNHVH